MEPHLIEKTYLAKKGADFLPPLRCTPSWILIVLAATMLAPNPACDFVNENAPHPGAPNQGARKQGLQAKQGLNGAPI